MNFIEAISSGFNNYFNFKDRASKSAFWYFLLFEFIYFFIAGFLLGMMGVSEDIFSIATLFIVTSILLTILSNKNLPNSSVLEKVDEKEDNTEPQIPKSD